MQAEKERKELSGIRKLARDRAKKSNLHNKKLRDCRVHLGDLKKDRRLSSQVLRRPQVSFSVIARLLVQEQLSRHVLRGSPVGPSQQALQRVRSRL